MHRSPKSKDQVRILREALTDKNLRLSQGEAQETVARMNGYASWNAFKADERQDPAEPRLVDIRVVQWSIVHHHRHGEDVFTLHQEDAPSEEEAIALIDGEGGGFEPEYGESLEILGPEVLNLRIDLASRSVKPVQRSPQTVSVFEVCMTDYYSYDTPEDVPAWQWVESLARFEHKGNGVESGVWEFMVRTETAVSAKDIPELLKEPVLKAHSQQCPWILFHQG